MPGMTYEQLPGRVRFQLPSLHALLVLQGGTATGMVGAMFGIPPDLGPEIKRIILVRITPFCVQIAE
jgi:hypothetical protein